MYQRVKINNNPHRLALRGFSIIVGGLVPMPEVNL